MNEGKKVKKSCPLCLSLKTNFFLQAQDTEGISAKRYQYYQCRRCGLVFLFPLPDKKELAPFYQKDYFSGSWFLEFFQRERRLVVEKQAEENLPVGKQGRILDFGCGEGIFLNLMKKHHWRVAGFDDSPQAVIAAQQKINQKIATPPLTKNSFPVRSFDIITLWHTLEHLSKPLPLFKTLRHFLADEGFLVISVPNIVSYEAKIGRDKWFHLDPPRHCCHYFPQSLNFLLKKAGFKITEISFFSLEYNFPGLWQTVLNRLGSSPNFFYHLIKRQPNINLSKKKYLSSLLISIFGGLVILLPVFFLSLLLSAREKSGSIRIVAKKVDKNEEEK